MNDTVFTMRSTPYKFGVGVSEGEEYTIPDVQAVRGAPVAETPHSSCETMELEDRQKPGGVER